MAANTAAPWRRCERARATPPRQPTADLLQADQLVYQEVLRRLCIDSGACVVITDQIAAKGKEDREENEMGRVLPMTLGGLEYFVDVMVELSMRVEGFETVRVARVIKTNSPYFPMGLELVNPTFADFLARMEEAPAPKAEVEDVPEFLRVAEPEPAETGPTLDDLVAQAQVYGIDRAKLLTAASHYHGVSALETLTPAQIDNLLGRLNEKYAPVEAAKEPKPAKREKVASS